MLNGVSYQVGAKRSGGIGRQMPQQEDGCKGPRKRLEQVLAPAVRCDEYPQADEQKSCPRTQKALVSS